MNTEKINKTPTSNYDVMGTQQRQSNNASYSTGDLTARLDSTSGTYAKAPIGNQMSSSAPKVMQYHANGSTSLDDALMQDETTNSAVKRAKILLGSIGYSGQAQPTEQARGGYNAQPSESAKNFLAQVIVYTEDAKGNKALVVANYAPNGTQPEVNYGGAKRAMSKGTPYAGNTPAASYRSN